MTAKKKAAPPTRSLPPDYEEHPSWGHATVSKVQASKGQVLFDSDILHREFIVMRVQRASRKRELLRDWIFERGAPLIEIRMSMAQWGALVSSFGSSGVPVTIEYTEADGNIEPEPYDRASRLAVSLGEISNATKRGLETIENAYNDLLASFKANAGRKVLADKLFHLECMIRNGPSNMTYAAKTLTEHTENTITKAKADIEAMVTQHAKTLGIEAGDFPTIEIEGPTS